MPGGRRTPAGIVTTAKEGAHGDPWVTRVGAVSSKGLLEDMGGHGGPDELEQRSGVAARVERRSPAIEHAPAKESGGRGPGDSVATSALGSRIGTERDELGEVRDGRHVAERGDRTSPCA